MPELPEVETVARMLSPFVRGQRLLEARFFDPKLGDVGTIAPLLGQTVTDVQRYGKEVVFVGEQSSVAIHLRMTGRLLCEAEAVDPADMLSFYRERVRFDEQSRRHVRAEFRFENISVIFVDPRRFGTIRLVSSPNDVLRGARDPVREELTADVLRALMKQSRQAIKQWLLRQDCLVGIGNIYASEILFQAKILPTREVSSLSLAECVRLAVEIPDVLNRAIECCGTTFSDFQRPDGTEGGFQNFLQVYDRVEQPCRVCQAPITRIVQQQRSTYFCSRCQDPEEVNVGSRPEKSMRGTRCGKSRKKS